MYNRYNFIFILKYYYYPIEPNILRALNNACFFKLFLAAVIEPVFSKVFEAAEIAVTHFLPGFVFLLVCVFLPPFILLNSRKWQLLMLLRLKVITKTLL